MEPTLDYAPPTAARNSKAMVWTGRVISAIPVLMMLMGFVFFFAKPEMVKQEMIDLGFKEKTAPVIVILEIICVVIYVIPQTAVLGAILLTGYLGGATACHVRADQPFFGPVLFGVLVWLGLFFRDARIRDLTPFRRL